ncbi:hypothetical protein MA16_Dca012821 [Dendrobium catenatum]|uniref:Uncharacterized protein n=1 Tax=Dendrobium catenatum TaxID=906689 RepID=A0A2I0VXL0_9ASPA|nr:hypothetical protein MA16_Dca012821 [Dendrobium catenatum]
MTLRADSHRLLAMESSSASRTALGQRLLNLDDPAFLSMPMTAASVLKILDSSPFDVFKSPSKSELFFAEKTGSERLLSPGGSKGEEMDHEEEVIEWSSIEAGWRRMEENA